MIRSQRGFTLMELMVVIVIVAILAAVAVPLYINYVKDAQRTEAKGAIGAIITAEQTEFQKNGAYVDVTAFVQDPGATPGSQSGLNCDLTEALTNWDFSVSGSGPNGFIATAVGKGDRAGLQVKYTYVRNGASTWDEADPPEGAN